MRVFLKLTLEVLNATRSPPGGKVIIVTHFKLDSFALSNTRAVHNDTDYVGIGLSRNGVQMPPIVTRYGDVNNGTHTSFTVPMSFSLSSYSENDDFVFCYFIINHGGGSTASVEAAVTAAIPLLSPGAVRLNAAKEGQAIDTIGPPGLSASDNLHAFWNLAKPAFNHVGSDHCDGPVAINAFAFKGLAIEGLTLASQQKPFSIIHLGIDSAVGCGSNSHYSVQWQVTP